MTDFYILHSRGFILQVYKPRSEYLLIQFLYFLMKDLEFSRLGDFAKEMLSVLELMEGRLEYKNIEVKIWQDYSLFLCRMRHVEVNNSIMILNIQNCLCFRND